MSDEPSLFDLLRAALTDMPHGERGETLRGRLKDPETALLRWLAMLVADRDTAALRVLIEGTTPLHQLVSRSKEHSQPVPEGLGWPFVAGERAGACALRALAALASTLLNADSSEQDLTIALTWLQYARISTPISARRWPDPTGLLDKVGEGFSMGVASTAAVFLLYLNGELAIPKAAASVTVLFDRGNAGQRAEMRVFAVPGWPPGLYPHPGRMAMLTVDTTFQNGLGKAWEQAGLRRFGPAVLWAIDDMSEPKGHIIGPSVTAAFATLINEIMRRVHPVRRVIAVRRLRPNTAIVGAIDETGAMVKVGGYERKLPAAGPGIRVIVPLQDAGEARLHVDEQEIVPAKTWKSASAHARSLNARELNRRLRPALAAVLILTMVVAAAWLVAARGESAQRRNKAVEKLVNSVAEVADQDPRLATLLAAYAFYERPDAKTRRTLLNTLASSADLGLTVLSNTQGGVRTAAVVTDTYEVTAGRDQSLRSWNLTNGQQTDSHKDQGNVVALTPDPAIPGAFAAVTSTGAVTFWQCDTQGRLTAQANLATSGETVRAAAFSPDGVTLVLTDSGGVLRFIDTQTHKLTGTMRLPFFPTTGRDTTSLAFGVAAANGRVPLYVGLADASVKASLWQVSVFHGRASAAHEVDIGGHDGVRSLAFMYNDAYGFDRVHENPGLLAIGTGQGLQLWDPVSHRDAAQFPVGNIVKAVHQVTYSPDRLQVVTDDGVTQLTGSPDFVDSYRRPGVAVAENGNQLTTLRRDGSTFVWKDQRPLSGAAGADDPGLLGGSALFDESGRVLVAGQTTQVTQPTSILSATGLRLFHQPDLKPLATMPVSTGMLLATNSHYAVVTERGQHAPLVIIDLGTGATRTLTPCAATAAAFDLRGSRLAVGCTDGQLVVLDTAGWRTVANRETGPEPISAVRYSSTGDALVVGSAPEGGTDYPGNLRFLDAHDPNHSLIPPKVYPGGITELAVAGPRIYSGGADGHVRAWSTRGQAGSEDFYVGDRVTALAVAGERVVASDGQRLFLLDGALTPIMSAPLAAPRTDSAELSPDGETLVTGTRTVELGQPHYGLDLWYIGDSSLLPQACAAAGRSLTAAEWARYSDSEVTRPRLCTRPVTPTPTPSQTESPSMIASSGPAVAARFGTCADFVPVKRCGLVPSGYAWTITQQDQLASKVTFYRRATTGWEPVLANTGTATWQFADVQPATRAPQETTYLVVLNTSASVGFYELTLVRAGQIVGHFTGTKIRLRVVANGVHVLEPVFPDGNTGGDPNGYLSRMLQPGAGSTWIETPPVPVPPDTKP